MFYWILLALAIVAEITGTLSMKWASVSGGHTGYIFNAGNDCAFLYFSRPSPLKKLLSVWRMRYGKVSVFC